MDFRTGFSVMMLALPCALFALCIGLFVGGKIKSRAALKVTAILFVVSLLGAIGSLVALRFVRDLQLMFWQPWTYVPMMAFLGACFGMVNERSRRSMNKWSAKHLETWQKRLEQDKAAGAAPLVLARDLEKIGDILSKDLGRSAEALPFYQQVYEILTREIGDHPDQIAFLEKYGALASKFGESGRALELEGSSLERSARRLAANVARGVNRCLQMGWQCQPPRKACNRKFRRGRHCRSRSPSSPCHSRGAYTTTLRRNPMFFLKSLRNVQFSMVALLMVTLFLGVTGCSAPPDNPAAQQAAALAEKKVASVDAGNFDKLVLKAEAPVLIWFYNGYNSSYFRDQHKIMESLSDHYGDALKVVKVDDSTCPQIKWTMDPNDPEPWSRYSGCGVWLLRFPDGKCARLSMVNREVGTANAPTVEQFIWFIDHARQVAPLTASGGNPQQPADK